jgi:hypothetical protein
MAKICPGAAPPVWGRQAMFLDSFKRSIINQIVAMDDGRELHDSLEPYFRAFTGAFDPGMPFTFYFEARNRPAMFVYDPLPEAARSSRAQFTDRCERIKAGILPITNFAQELADGKYLAVTPLEFSARPPLPPNHESCWRKYRHFYADVMEGLELACFFKLTPTQKLYDLWLKFNADALVG